MLSRVFAHILLAGPIRHRLAGTMLRGLLITLAIENGRSDVVDEFRPKAEPMPPPAPDVAGLFAEAQRQVEEVGGLMKAARTIERALKKAPDDVACLALAVMIHTMMRGNFPLAESHGRRAVALAPRVAALRINLGNCLREQRKYEDALACYGEALALAPKSLEAQFNLAKCLGQLGRRDEAKIIWRGVAALPAETLPARLCRATALVALGQYAEAEPILEDVLAEVPSHTVAKMELATVYHRRRRNAEHLLVEIVEAEPGNWGALIQLAQQRHAMGRFAEAEETARQATKINPDDPNVLIVLANTLSDRDKLQEAEELARKALSREPGTGVPSHRHVLGVILERQGRYAEAGQIFETVAADEPEEGWARVTVALHLLRQGDFRRGWAEHEWRWRWEQHPEPPRDYPQPLFSLKARKKSRVLVWAEQGLGDTVQFSRFIPLLAEMGYRPILEIQPPVKTLIAGNFGLPTFVHGETLPEFDYQIPFLSLCYALGTEPETIPGRAGYLHAGENATAKWKERLQPDGRLMVGLNWAGNALHRNDFRRSIALERIAPFLDIDGIRFVSLQKDLRQGNGETLRHFADRIDFRLIEQSEDYADSAGLIANLDLVISIDGGVAHLAGALGKPVWMMLPFSPDWRWLTDREDSIWYESMRLFRQSAPSDWEPVIARIADELRRLAAKPIADL